MRSGSGNAASAAWNFLRCSIILSPREDNPLPKVIQMTRTADDRPPGLMADLENAPRPVRRLPNARALEVLNQMYAYHDIQSPVGQAASAFDTAA